jgi:sugar phosphate isomerase/epimerase
MKAGVMEDVLQTARDEETFARAKRLGFTGVEVVPARAELERGDRLEPLRRARDETGLEVPSLVLGEHSDLGGIADADPVVAEHARVDVARAIDWAVALGADAILVPFFGRAELVDDADLDRAAAAFGPLCRQAGERGVTLCYEGTLPAPRILALSERVGSRAFGCYFDLANPVVRGLDTATEIRALAGLIRRVHFKDTRVTAGDCAPGLGRVDFAESHEALGEIGYDGWLVLETPPAPPELVARDLGFARSVFPSLERSVTWPRLGIFTYDFAAGEWDRLVETCRRMGLETVQLGMPMLEECLERPDRIDALVELLADADISIAALAGYRNLVAPDPGKRRANIDFLQRCLELAPRFGTSVVATESGTRHPEGDWTDSPENWRPETWELLDEAIGELLPVAQRSGSILALEGSVKNVLRTAGQLTGLLERFPSPHLQVVCDPYNYLSSHLLPARERVTTAFLQGFEHRFVLAHLKDVDPGGAETGTGEFGTGVFPQRPYVDFLRERRPDLPIIIEHLPLDHVPRAISLLRELSRSAAPSASPPAADRRGRRRPRHARTQTDA